MARLRGVCAPCRAKNVGPSHWQTDTHRKRMEKAEHIADLVGDIEPRRAGAWSAGGVDAGTAEENEAAARRLAGEPPAWIDESGDVPDWMDPDYREPTRPERGLRPGPCPRCGRADFRTEKGRAWHLANVPACTAYVRPGRHEYVTIGA